MKRTTLIPLRKSLKTLKMKRLKIKIKVRYRITTRKRIKKIRERMTLSSSLRQLQ